MTFPALFRHVWPRSLAARTALVLLVAFAVVQVAGLTIFAFDRVDVQRLEQARGLSIRVTQLYRALVMLTPEDRLLRLRAFESPPDFVARIEPAPPHPEGDWHPIRPRIERMAEFEFRLAPLPPPMRPREVRLLTDGGFLLVGLRLPDGPWLIVQATRPEGEPWHQSRFLLAFLGMALAGALLIFWAVRRLTAPVRLLAAAAEALGRDVNAPPLPETGPTELAKAAVAFNTMAARIRRFVQDRTFLLTALSHDLRTPITRLKLRAEFMEDDEQRRKMLADLDELAAMVSSTLAFGREVSASEAPQSIDLPALIRTVLDEAADATPDTAELEMAQQVPYQGPDHLTLRARPVSIKRALANLVGNALAYGGNARVILAPSSGGMVRIDIEDDGPGVPETELERLFEPFYRLEASRNRETGGTGLGLPIARNIARAHGGDIVLANRPGGGLRARLTLPD